MLKLDRIAANLHDSFAQHRRTYRVFNKNARADDSTMGRDPERLLKQNDGSFAIRSSPMSNIVPPAG